jgi:hypothetical protein
LPAVSLDPGSHHVEDLRLEVSWSALGILAAAYQSGVFEHFQMFGHCLYRHVVRRCQLAHGGIPDGKPSHNVTPRRVGQGGEDSGESILAHGSLLDSVFNRLVE